MNLHKKYFTKIENILDFASYGKTWLQNKRITEIVKNTLHHYGKKRYNLIGYTIMPNHFHLVILPSIDSYNNFLHKHTVKKNKKETFYFITKIMQDIKKYTAKESNQSIKS